MIKRVQELSQELDSVSNDKHSTDSYGFASVEPTLVKLNDFIQSKVRLADFTLVDKANLVEIFVTHQKTLMAIY